MSGTWYNSLRKVGIGLGCVLTLTSGALAQTAAPAPATAPPRAAAEPNSFAAVTKHLDPNGGLYAYVSAAEFMQATREVLDLLVPMCALALDQKMEDPEDRATTRGLVQIANLAFDESGLREISGFGMSSLAVDKRLYRTRSFVHHNPNQSQGKLWKALGQAPHPLTGLGFLPKNTALGVFTDLDLNLLWDWHKTLVERCQNPALIASYNQSLAELRKVVDLEALIRSTAGEVGMIVTLDDTRKIVIPGNNLDIPEPGLAILLKVKDDTLRRFFEKTIQDHGLPMAKQQLADIEATVIPLPLPLPLEVKPTLAIVDGYLILSLNPALLQEIINVRKGQTQGLAAAADFKQLMQKLPREGNSVVYLSPRFSKTMNDVQLAVTHNLKPDFRALLTKFYALQGAEHIYSMAVGQVLPDGLLTTAYTNANPGRTLALQLAALPVMFLAAAVRNDGDEQPGAAGGDEQPGAAAGGNAPPRAAGRPRADSAENLKQIGLACLMYAGENAGNFPSPDGEAGFTELAKQQILMPGQAYLHPQDKQRQVLADATTLSDKNCSYVYFGAGYADNDKELTKLPLAFEKPGIVPDKLNVLFADGHVEAFTTDLKNSTALVEFLHKKLTYSERRYKALQIKAKKLDAGPAPVAKP